MGELWFRFRWNVDPDRLLVTGPALTVRLRESPEITGRLLPPGDVAAEAVAEAEGRCEVSLETVQAFEDMSRRRLPAGSDVAKDPAEGENVRRWLTGEIGLLVMPVLRHDLQVLVHDSREDLQRQARRMIELLRWVTNAPGSHHPFRSGALEFSLDGTQWHLAPKRPPNAPTGLRVHQGVALARVDPALVSGMAVAGQSEPVGHSLIREALDLAGRAPRASVVIATAAVETAVKQAVSILTTEASYLVDEMPSPPVLKLLKVYLPSLPSLGVAGAAALPAPKHIHTSVQWLVETRNAIVHKRQSQQWFPDLAVRLAHAQDLVWLLDAYCGHDWALSHVSPETRQQTGA